jgi:hypothetical protein
LVYDTSDDSDDSDDYFLHTAIAGMIIGRVNSRGRPIPFEAHERKADSI